MYWLNCYLHKNVGEYNCNYILTNYNISSKKKPKFKMNVECKCQSEQLCFLTMCLIYFTNGNAFLK